MIPTKEKNPTAQITSAIRRPPVSQPTLNPPVSRPTLNPPLISRRLERRRNGDLCRLLDTFGTSLTCSFHSSRCLSASSLPKFQNNIHQKRQLKAQEENESFSKWKIKEANILKICSNLQQKHWIYRVLEFNQSPFQSPFQTSFTNTKHIWLKV